MRKLTFKEMLCGLWILFLTDHVVRDPVTGRHHIVWRV